MNASTDWRKNVRVPIAKKHKREIPPGAKENSHDGSEGSEERKADVLLNLSRNVDALMTAGGLSAPALSPDRDASWLRLLRNHHRTGGGSMPAAHHVLDLARRLDVSVEGLLSVDPSLQPGGNNERMSPGPDQPTVAGRDMVTVLEISGHDGEGLGEAPASKRWVMPAHMIERSTVSSPSDLRMVPVWGDSLQPLLSPGTRVMVDMRDRAPSPPGLFLIYDGIGHRIMRLEYLPRTEPKMVRCSPVNPVYSTFDAPLDQLRIEGRVKGHWAET